MKVAVIFYHKNLHTIYPQRWIDKCVESIASQTYKDFDVIELNYGGFPQQYDPPPFYAEIKGKTHIGLTIPMDNHIHAMNHLLNYCFKEKKYDVVFNTNMDDYFHPERFAKQIAKIEEGFDLVSSDFCYIEEMEREVKPVFDDMSEYLTVDPKDCIAPLTTNRHKTGNDLQASKKHTQPREYLKEASFFPLEKPVIEKYDAVILHKNICQHGDITKNLLQNHNVIAHPCVAFSKTFWTDGVQYQNLLGKEDLDLWQRTIKMGKRFFIVDEELLFYRIHKNQVGKLNPAT